MRLRNKILLTIGSIILIIILIIMNLKTYAPYYAMHMPKPEGAHPEVYFALLNLDDIHKPESDDFEYEAQDFNRYMKAIRVHPGSEWQCGFLLNGKENPVTSAMLKGKEQYDFNFDQNFFIIRIEDQEDDWKEVHLSNTEKEEIRQELLEDLQPLFDAHYQPLFNLQWLFNWIYGDFVNG